MKWYYGIIIFALVIVFLFVFALVAKSGTA